MTKSLVLGLGLAVLTCFCQGRGEPGEERILGPLKRAGIDLNDEDALVRTLQRKDGLGLATSAAYALGNLPRTPVIVRELNLAALSDDENLMNYAIRSLLKHEDREWIAAAAARLPNVRNRAQQLHLAGELARAGRYDGWDLIEAAVVSGDIWLETALFEVGSFRGMKDASGKPVHLMAKLDELAVRAPESARSAIARTIVRIGIEDNPELRGKRRSVPK